MKIKFVCLAMALVGLTSSYASAADGTLNFVGNIVNSSCTINGLNNGVLEVKMGSVPLSAIKSSPDGTGPQVGVNITVTNCEPGTYYIVLDGTSATEAGKTNVLALNSDDVPAKNVGILLTDRNNQEVTLDKPFNPSEDPSITIAENNNSGTFNLKAYYYSWDKNNATAGNGNATARFTIVQQ